MMRDDKMTSAGETIALFLNMFLIFFFLTKHFSKTYEEGKYPQEWTKAMIVPIHTQKNRHRYSKQLPGNLNINVTSKLFTCVLHKGLTTWTQDNNTISDALMVSEREDQLWAKALL